MYSGREYGYVQPVYCRLRRLQLACCLSAGEDAVQGPTYVTFSCPLEQYLSRVWALSYDRDTKYDLNGLLARVSIIGAEK